MNLHYTLGQAISAIQKPVELTPQTRKTLQDSVDFLHKFLEQSDKPIYGVNTGFGSLQNIEISSSELSKLQENLLITHAAGVGSALNDELVLTMMWLKLLNMSKGHSAVRPEVFERLAYMFNHQIIPLVTEQGSLGASGDLAPLSQMVLPLIGKGSVKVNGSLMPASDWLTSVGFQPIVLGPKEALALINGTQFMLAHALVAFKKISDILAQLPLIASLSIDAYDCRLEPFHEAIHRVRPHQGQIQAAEEIRSWLADSEIAAMPKKQVQDPYSFRCIPQVHGATITALQHCFSVWETELNSVTDNPNVFEEENMVVSGGNFHGQPLALTLDYAAMALAELANISERRTFLLVSGQRQLSPYLADGAGIDSGYMIAQYSAAALVSQNKQLCTPASVDSIVSSNGQEDHVSMGANAATKLMRVLDNVEYVLSIEWLCGVAALSQRKLVSQKKSSNAIEAAVDAFLSGGALIHQEVPMQELMKRANDFLWKSAKN
ncbi:MAG: histidine ammonia-lyase [Bacteroidia bacterium]|nr:histidine ammonia-lyase [Bacteroidia bacterium]